MERVAQRNTERIWEELSLVFMDNETITPINLNYLDRNHATDVISFAYPPAFPFKKFTGEVFVNVERALEEGPERKGTDYELALYIAHGCHHLSGANDATPSEQKTMHETEQAWLKDASAENLIRGIIA